MRLNQDKTANSLFFSCMHIFLRAHSNELKTMEGQFGSVWYSIAKLPLVQGEVKINFICPTCSLY
jgi:hypothetical protein